MRIPRSLYYDGALPGQAVRVAAKISKLGYRDGVGCTMTADHLAWQLGVNPSTTNRALAALTKARVLHTSTNVTSLGSKPAERRIVRPRRAAVSGWVDVPIGAVDSITSGPQFVAFAEALYLARTGAPVTSQAIGAALGVRTSQAVAHLRRIAQCFGTIQPLHRAGPGGSNLYLVRASRDDSWINEPQRAVALADGPSARRLPCRVRTHRLRATRRAKAEIARALRVPVLFSGTPAIWGGSDAHGGRVDQGSDGGLCEASAGGGVAGSGAPQSEVSTTVNRTVECDLECERLARPAEGARHAPPGPVPQGAVDAEAGSESGAGAPGRTESHHHTSPEPDPRVGVLTGRAAAFVTTVLDAWEDRDRGARAAIAADADWRSAVDALADRATKRSVGERADVSVVVDALGWHARKLPTGRAVAVREAIAQALDGEGIEPRRLAIRVQTHMARLDARGEPIRDVVGWLRGFGLVRPYGCADPACENGALWPSWHGCALCAERKAALAQRSRGAGGTAVASGGPMR